MVGICLEDVSSVAPMYLSRIVQSRGLWLISIPREAGQEQMELGGLAVSNTELQKVNFSVTTGETQFFWLLLIC